jgi:hypothetical protein
MVVFDGLMYIREKLVIQDNKVLHYMKCRTYGCKARAQIKDRVMKLKENKPHTCDARRGVYDRVQYQQALNRMKQRAQKEASSYLVRV